MHETPATCLFHGIMTIFMLRYVYKWTVDFSDKKKFHWYKSISLPCPTFKEGFSWYWKQIAISGNKGTFWQKHRAAYIFNNVHNPIPGKEWGHPWYLLIALIWMIPLRSKFLRKCVYINMYIKMVKNGEKYVWLLCEYIFHVGSPGGRSVKVTSSGTFSALRPLGVEHPHLFHQQRKRITTKDHNKEWSTHKPNLVHQQRKRITNTSSSASSMFLEEGDLMSKKFMSFGRIVVWYKIYSFIILIRNVIFSTVFPLSLLLTFVISLSHWRQNVFDSEPGGEWLSLK